MSHTSHFTHPAPDHVVVMIGTNKRAYEQMQHRIFNPLVFASDNLETVAHYYEGCALELTVTLDPALRQDYVRDASEVEGDLAAYTYGYALMRCPEGATWYSFSAKYLEEHLVSLKEIFPDLTPWNEEE